jgi:integrase
VATVTKVTRKVRGKAYEYHAVRFTDPGTGKEKLRYFGTKKEADKARTDIEMRLEAGTYSGEAHKATVRDIVKRFREAGYFPKGEEPLRSTTVADYETALEERILPRWGATRLVDIRASTVESWRNEMLVQGHGKSPVRKALIVMGRLYRFAKRDHIVTHNPTVDVGKPTVRSRKGAEERLTPEQLADLFDVVSGRTQVVVHIGARIGMREGEIFGLLWGSVELQNRRIRCAGSSRTVSLSNSQRRMRALETYRSTPSWPAYSRSGNFRCHLSASSRTRWSSPHPPVVRSVPRTSCCGSSTRHLSRPSCRGSFSIVCATRTRQSWCRPTPRPRSCTGFSVTRISRRP